MMRDDGRCRWTPFKGGRIGTPERWAEMQRRGCGPSFGRKKKHQNLGLLSFVDKMVVGQNLATLVFIPK